MRWKLTISSPGGHRSEFRCVASTLYQAVDKLRSAVHSLDLDQALQLPHIELRQLKNLHNQEGIKDIAQIAMMVHALRARQHILEPSGLPNIKILLDDAGDWLLFDGHHTVLAYLLAGYREVNEVPCLILYVDSVSGRVPSDAIRVVFGQHAKDVTNWRDFAINWQAPVENQLTSKKQQTMGELVDVIRPFVQ